MPKSAIKSQAVGSSALRNDMVLPEQAPPCSQSTFVIGYDFSIVDVERYTGLFHGIIPQC
jgi:hypothetical protein